MRTRDIVYFVILVVIVATMSISMVKCALGDTHVLRGVRDTTAVVFRNDEQWDVVGGKSWVFTGPEGRYFVTADSVFDFPPDTVDFVMISLPVAAERAVSPNPLLNSVPTTYVDIVFPSVGPINQVIWPPQIQTLRYPGMTGSLGHFYIETFENPFGLVVQIPVDYIREEFERVLSQKGYLRLWWYEEDYYTNFFPDWHPGVYIQPINRNELWSSNR